MDVLTIFKLSIVKISDYAAKNVCAGCAYNFKRLNVFLL